MQDNEEKKVTRTKTLMELRGKIYFLESDNIHKKQPLSDSEMVDRLIKEIIKTVDKEEANQNDN
ncbi:MAG: hypothetical protein ACI4WG_04815 [Erysipelotrichaceae bacterium]